MSTSYEAAGAPPPTYADIEQWLRSALAELLNVRSDEVDIKTRFARFGVDSASALIITDMLSEWLGLELDSTLLYEYETIEQLARHLAPQVAAKGSP